MPTCYNMLQHTTGTAWPIPEYLVQVSFPGQHLPLGSTDATGDTNHEQREEPLGQCITHAGTKTSCLIMQLALPPSLAGGVQVCALK